MLHTLGITDISHTLINIADIFLGNRPRANLPSLQQLFKQLDPYRKLSATTTMATSNPEVNLIEQLSQLTSRLSSKEDPGARKEALQLSKRLTASLEKPEDVAVSLAFSVFKLYLFILCLCYIDIYLQITSLLSP